MFPAIPLAARSLLQESRQRDASNDNDIQMGEDAGTVAGVDMGDSSDDEVWISSMDNDERELYESYAAVTGNRCAANIHSRK